MAESPDEINLTASGAATNTGIDYQQRVAAWFMVHALAGAKISSVIGEDPGDIKSFSFETGESIDDLKITCSNKVLFFQVKHSVSLSAKVTSDFYKAIRQFVLHYLNEPNGIDLLILATSSKSSRKITRDLFKVLLGIRYGDKDFAQAPLSKSESEAYKALRGLVESVFTSERGTPASEDEFFDLCSRMRLLTLDVESGMPHESSIMVILGSKSSVQPELIWSALISNALTFASNRLLVSKNKLEEQFGKYLRKDGQAPRQIDNDLLRPMFQGKMPAGKDFVLTTPMSFFLGEFDYMLSGLYRFDDDCSKRISYFSNNKLRFMNGEIVTVLARAASFEGLNRIMDEVKLGDGNSVAVFIPENFDENETAHCSRVHGEHLNYLVSTRNNLLECMHCGKPISESNAHLIEVDDKDLGEHAGLIHRECRRPIDRIIGWIKCETFDEYPFLKRFDFQKWIDNAPNGQSLIWGAKRAGMGRPVVIGWNPGHVYNQYKDYCIRFDLEDGSVRYAKQRSQIVRLSAAEADDMKSSFIAMFENARNAGNPFCYGSSGDDFAVYSNLVITLEGDEIPIEITGVEVAHYNKLIAESSEKKVQAYAPLVVLNIPGQSEPLQFDDRVAFITQPLELQKYIDNWKRSGVEIPEYELLVIGSDQEFDELMRTLFSKGIKAVVDPLVDSRKKFFSGIYIENINEFRG